MFSGHLHEGSRTAICLHCAVRCWLCPYICFCIQVRRILCLESLLWHLSFLLHGCYVFMTMSSYLLFVYKRARHFSWNILCIYYFCIHGGYVFMSTHLFYTRELDTFHGTSSYAFIISVILWNNDIDCEYPYICLYKNKLDTFHNTFSLAFTIKL